MFRKPVKKSKIQRRQLAHSDSEEEDPPIVAPAVSVNKKQPEAPPPPVISKKEIKSKLLSFADEEEDGEVFQVRKSSQSKRMAKLRHKQRQNTVDTLPTMDIDIDTKQHQDEPEIVIKKSYEGLILSGRAALAAVTEGDMSDEADDTNETEFDNAGFHSFRAESVRAAIDKGGIPDAALIHAARKSRQRARETGRGAQDYLPIKGGDRPVETNSTVINNRLVREDGSGDDDDDERIEVRGVVTDEKRVGAEVNAIDSGGEEWEEQQLSKAQPALLHPNIHYSQLPDTELNPFASLMPMAPAAPTIPQHMLPLRMPDDTKPTTMAQLVSALKHRLEEANRERAERHSQLTELRQRLEVLKMTRDRLAEKSPQLDQSYRITQYYRGYITDLLECVDEKMPALQSLEARALSLHKKRCEFIVERRRQDIRDQAQDVLNDGVNREPMNEAKQRRAAEREGRRRGRRLARGDGGGGNTLTSSLHKDGDSSDDELPTAVRDELATIRDEIQREAGALFSDASSAYASVGGVCGKLSRWRRVSRDIYTDCYLPDCLPKLVAPFVRAQLILWNPLADEDNQDFETMDWYRRLMMYGVSRNCAVSDDSSSGGGDSSESEEPPSVRDDPDAMLTSVVVSKLLVTKLQELVENAFDPFCVRSCVRLNSLLPRLTVLCPREVLAQLAGTVRQALSCAAQRDVMLPPVPQKAINTKAGVFWRRCLGACVRVLRAALTLSTPPLQRPAEDVAYRLLQSACWSCSSAGGACAALASSWFLDIVQDERDMFIHKVKPLIVKLAKKSIEDLSGDVMQMKYIEMARSVVSQLDKYQE